MGRGIVQEFLLNSGIRYVFNENLCHAIHGKSEAWKLSYVAWYLRVLSFALELNPERLVQLLLFRRHAYEVGSSIRMILPVEFHLE